MNENSVSNQIVFVRHGVHVCGRLPIVESIAMIRTGEILKDRGVVATSVISSPQPRALETALAITAGMGVMGVYLPIRTSDSIGDVSLGRHPFSSDQFEAAKAIAERDGVTIERVLSVHRDFADIMANRGEEGAEAVFCAIGPRTGQTLLVVSHGGSRLEAVIAALSKKPVDKDHIFTNGGVAIATMNDANATIAEIQYFGRLAEARMAAAAPIPEDKRG